MYLFVCDGVAGTGGCNTFTNNLSGGLGTYSYGPTSIADGYFRWTNATQFNYTITPHNNWDYRYNPYTPYFEDGPRFLLDRVAPNSAASYSQGAGGGATIAYEFTNTAQDTLAGLADSTLFIENLTSGGLATQVHNFSVGSGIVGGPSDEQIITMSANLAYNTTYRYRFETTDAATNNTFTSWVTFTTPAPPAFSVDLQTPPTVTAGADFDLTWVTTGATNCTASLGTPAWQSSSPASGGGTWTQTGGITSDTTYRIECMDSGGNTQSDEETVVVEYECNDGINNDPSEDSLVDAADPGCWTDPLDPGTYDPTDDSEADSPQCNDGVDNGDPEDTLSDTNDPGCWTDPLDPGTYDPNDNDETDPVPQCSDGVDNADPEDTLADTNDPGCWSNPTDPGTYDPNDTDETDPVAQCGDGIDNDGDGYTDTGDPNCHSDQNPYNPASYDPFDDDESGPLYECNDGINNDPAEDSLVDADDPQCHTDNSPDGANPALDPSYDPTDNVEASPVDVTLTASDLTPPFAGDSTLEWIINSGAPDSCTATGDVANYSGGLWNGAKSPAGGNVTLNTILSTQTYTIRCERSSDGEFDVQSRTITPAPPVFPDIEITSDQVFARPGEDVQLTWSVSDTTNVSNCTITHLGPVSPNDISSSGPINAERTFTFVCEYYGLPFSDSVTVQVLPQIEET